MLDSPGPDPDPRHPVLLSSCKDSSSAHTNDIDTDIACDLPSTKCLGTFATMASPTASPAAPVPAAESRPLNPNMVYLPTTPPYHLPPGTPSHDGGGAGTPRVCAKFRLSGVALLRFLAIVFNIVLVVLEICNRKYYSGVAKVFISLAFVQLSWLFLALLAQACGRRPRRGRPEDRRRGVTLDLGFVRCIFGRRGYDDEDGGGDRLLGWPAAPVDGGKKRTRRRGMLCAAVDLAFAAMMLTVGLITVDNLGSIWYWETGVEIGAICFVVAVFDVLIAVAQRFAILKRARVRVLYDEDEDEDEDDVGSHKYRIRLPQSPEQRHATMSLAA